MRWRRHRLKKARRAGLADLENAHQLVVAIESLGKGLHGNPKAMLRDVECCLIAFAAQWDPDGETEDPNAARVDGVGRRPRICVRVSTV